MISRSIAALLLVSVGAVAVARAGSLALVYENDAAVAEGNSLPAPVGESGVVVPAGPALSHASTMLIGDEDGLFHAVLFRLDNDLNIAVMRRGEPVKDSKTVGRHLSRWSAATAFLSGAKPAVEAGGTVAAVSVATQPFNATVNGVGPDSTVVLKQRFNKAKFKLDVVNNSTSPVWAMSIRLSSDPKLSFWKEGRRSGLNEVPETIMTFDRQAILKPIAPGQTVSVTAEAYYMKGRDYTWTVETRSKALAAESRFAVRIE